MTSRMLGPRLLPMTIGMLAIVLVSKVISLAHGAWVSGERAFLMQPAWAAGAE